MQLLPMASFPGRGGGGAGWQKASVSDCLPLAAPIGLSPLLILTLCGPDRVLVVSTEPPDDLSCLTTPGVGCPGDGAVARAVDQGHSDAHNGGGGGVLPEDWVEAAGRQSTLGPRCCVTMCTASRYDSGLGRPSLHPYFIRYALTTVGDLVRPAREGVGGNPLEASVSLKQTWHSRLPA